MTLRKMTRGLWAVLLSGLFGLILAACGSGNGNATATAPIEFETPTPGGSAAATSPTAAASPTGAATVAGVAAPSASAAATTASGNQAATTIEITAKDIKFDKATLTVPAGQQITLKMTNDDDIPHNFAVYKAKGDANALFTGTIFKGPDVTKSETFTAPASPGTYYFQCDVHPDQMNGTLIVK